MKTFLQFFLFLFGVLAVRAQETINVTLGTPWSIGSSHGGSDDGSEFWNAVFLRSPSGQLYFDGTFAGVNAGGGSTSTTVVLNEAGVWQEWENVGYVSTQGGDNSTFLTRYLNVQGAANRPPSIGWQSVPGSVESGQPYVVSAQGSDPDGNLAQVNVWKNGQPFAFAGGGDGANGSSGNQTADNGPQTVTFTAQAVDAAGAVSELISCIVTVAPPPEPARYSLSTSTGGGGSVTGGGIFDAGTYLAVMASPDAVHDFWGWAGDASGTGNPLGITMDRDRNVQALFALKSFDLATGASSGGSVTAGGTYPYGTTVTLSATPAQNYRFAGWSGDAGGTAESVAITVDRAKSVYAQFTSKAAQSIAFPSPGNRPVGSTILNASASSGLPVSFVVLTGPASLNGNQLQITGSGSITIEATQGGDDAYLPAPSVAQSFNVIVASVTKYRPSARTLLSSSTLSGIAPLVLEKL